MVDKKTAEGGLRVLLAEDESLAALVIGDALVDMGHAVVHAGDGETALGLAAAAHFDVLVTDLAMPRMGGLELIPRLRADRPDLPVVMMTGYLPPDGATLLAAPSGGPMTLLLKPFALSQLVEALALVAPRAAAAPAFA
jgi:CheY-like chemotaxis protein